MEETIRTFNKQFAWEPKIENGGGMRHQAKFLVAGMGGSHLAADLLKVWRPSTDVIIHWGYNLPKLPEEYFADRLIIASSYSGNTEETLSSFEEARSRGLPTAVLTTGGKLLAMAQKANAPYARLPDIGIQPRMALGYALRGLMKLMGEREAYQELGGLAGTLKPDAFEQEGKEFASSLEGKIPVIYASDRLKPVAYNWKIKFNETGKIPAFFNFFSELNHNEMTGFDAKGKTKKLAEKFSFIFLRDETDDPRIAKRMDVLQELFVKRGLPVAVKELSGSTLFERIFNSLLLADWTALYLASLYGTEAEKVPMVEEFKKML